MLKLSRSGDDGEKVLLLVESGVRVHTIAVRVQGYCNLTHLQHVAALPQHRPPPPRATPPAISPSSYASTSARGAWRTSGSWALTESSTCSLAGRTRATTSCSSFTLRCVESLTCVCFLCVFLCPVPLCCLSVPLCFSLHSVLPLCTLYPVLYPYHHFQGNIVLTDASYNLLTLLRSHRDDAKGMAIMARHPYPIHSIRYYQPITHDALHAAAQHGGSWRGVLGSLLPYGPVVGDHCLRSAGLDPQAAADADSAALKDVLTAVRGFERFLAAAEEAPVKGYILTKPVKGAAVTCFVAAAPCAASVFRCHTLACCLTLCTAAVCASTTRRRP